MVAFVQNQVEPPTVLTIRGRDGSWVQLEIWQPLTVEKTLAMRSLLAKATNAEQSAAAVFAFVKRENVRVRDGSKPPKKAA